jgi:hypothetical protein
LIEAATPPWLVFLDPEDELVDSGLAEALKLGKAKGADIVQFGCQTVIRSG